MRSAALLAALACVASAAFSGESSSIFTSWDPNEDVRLVEDFDHISQIFHPQTHEVEHSRKKRNAVETARFASGNPITQNCDRPGYTGRYCEFPICESFNPISNPQQFQRDEGYIVDLTDLGACNRKQQIIVDDTMYDIRIEVQSLENVSPKLAIADETGYFGTPDQIVQEADRYVAHFNSLPPGLYTVIPSATSLDSHCILTTTAQTILTISGGFQTIDRDRNDFPNENAAAHQFNSIMLTLHGSRAPATLKTVSVVGPDNYLMRPRTLDKRYGCQYEFYFDSLFCFNRGSYALIAEGVDFNGNLFRRVAPFECTYVPVPTTPLVLQTTPQPTNPTACLNGGVLLADGGKTSCICQDHWTYFDCSQPLCINGGTLLQGKCFCPIGFEGVHCELVKCEPNSNFGLDVDHPTLVIVVRARFYQNEILKQVQQAIDEAVENLQFDPSYLARFHLVVFNNHKILLSKFYTSIQKFDFDFELQTQLTDRSGKCDDDVLAAVSAALTDASLTQGSMIYVITDALAVDYSNQIDAIVQLNSFAKATINFVYVQPDPNQKCAPADPSDPGFRAFDEVANRFGGISWSIQNRNKVYNVLFGHMNSILYKSQLMLDLDREECSKGLNKVMQLEKSTETLVFVSRGRDFDLDITAPDGSRVIPRLVTTEGIFTVRRWSAPIAGTYMIKASTESTTAACSLRAYQASQHSETSSSQAEVYWAITTDVDTDAMMNQPLAGMDNHPVFHIENFGEDYDHAFAFLNMYAVRGGVEQEVYASNGLFRGGCSFQFYFPSFRCRPNENLHYEFNLRNEEGFYVQRAGVMTCFNYVPTQSPPSDCQNAGVNLNGTCLCQPHYEGDHCESLICENGGTVLFGTCQCPAGWNGQFCTLAQCPESGPLPNFGYHVDMAFLVEVTEKGVQQIDQLLVNLPEILRDVGSQHAEWIDRLVLIGYDSAGVVGMVDTPIANQQLILDTLDQWSFMNPTDDQCTVQIYQALNALLTERRDGKKRRQLPERSIINIFTASIPNNQDDSSPLIESVSEKLLENRAITNVFRSTKWNQKETGFNCAASESDFQYIERIARRGDGMMYTMGNGDLMRAIRMIPTLFSSSIVFKYHEPWCDHQALVYFPVDAYTQTITAVVRGANAALDLTRYDGSSLPADGRVTILQDKDNLVVEFRNPCPTDWEPVSQYCMYISKSVKKNFTEASDLCASMGGFMTDDLGQAKNTWLDYALGQQQGWLGLSYINGEWLFQQDYGSTTPPPKNFNKWITGDAPADDSKGACAYIFNGLWYPMECDREYVVICQKHMYSPDNMPSNLGDNDISPGKYQLIVQTDMNVEDHSCDVEIRVQSKLNVEFGFVDDLRRDVPHPVANVDSNDNHVVASISIGTSKSQSVLLEHVLLRTDDADSTLLEAATYSPRIGCTYDYVSQPLNCDLTNGSDFSVVIIGQDDTGNTFQRYSTSLCSKWYDCQNGGVYSNGKCLCTDYYTGDQCETPLCQNGGKLSFHADSCDCLPNFGGDACQYVQCDVNSNATFTNDGKAFVLVLEKSASTADAIHNIAMSIHDLVENMWNRHERWVDKYMVQTFTLDGTVEELSVFVNSDQFTQYLLNVANQAKELPGTCEMPIWKALDHLFDSSLSQYLPGSEVLIVSAAAPDLSTPLSTIHETIEKFDIQTPIVDFLHIENVNCWITDWEKDVGDFANFIATTGGVMFRAQPPRAGEAVETFVPTRYAAQQLSYSDPYNCKINDIYIQIDSGMSLVYVLVGGGAGVTMTITTPLDDYIGFALFWYSEEQSFWGVYPKYPGIYKISISSDTAACFPVVYGSGGAVVTGGQHAAQVFSGFIQKYNYLDTPTSYAVYGAINFPVFFLYELPGNQLPTETLYTARMTRKTIDGKVEESYTSDVDMRDGCSYNYVGKAFTCAEENDVITLSISGVDGYNQPFTRQSTTYCKKETSKACKNGGVFSGGQCICADYYAGDLCEKPICQNGGYMATTFGVQCTCPFGFAGDACQFVHCDVNSQAIFSNDDKALVFIIEKSANTADAIKQIANSIHNLAARMHDRHQGWVEKYLVQVFTTEGIEYDLAIFLNTDQLTQYLLTVAKDAKAIPGPCKMPIWKVLDSLFDGAYTMYLPGSEVVIVSAAAPADADLASIHAAMEKFDIQTPIVDFLHIETADCPIEGWQKDLGDFSNFLLTTGGIVFRTLPEDAGLAVEEFVPTRYAAQRLSYSDPYNCKDNDIYVQVDTGMALLYVLVGQPGATMTVTSPLKDEVSQLNLWTSAAEQAFWGIYPKYPGIYKISINSDSPACFPVVYGSGGAVTTGGEHASQVFSGFIQGFNTIDTPKPYAVYGDVNFPVFFIYELEGHQLPTETLYTARMTRRSIDGKEEESYTSDVDMRKGCSYNYVGKAFYCVAENDVITLSISGVDGNNQPFTRQSTTYCKPEAPKDCKNDGVYSGGQCICPDYYAGDLCEMPLCQNDGVIAASGDKCNCKPGRAGDACQFVQCTANSDATFTNDGKAFVLVIEKTANTAEAIKKIALSFHTLVENMWDRHEGWINKYMVQTFALDGEIEELVLFHDTDQFTQYLLQMADEATQKAGACQMPIWRALDYLFDSQYAEYLPGSEVLLLSAAVPDATELASIHDTMEKFNIHTPVVDFLHIDLDQCPFGPSLKEAADFANFLSTTGGLVFRAANEMAGSSAEVFVPTRYAAQRLSYSDASNCKDNDIYVQVDTGMSLVYVMVGGWGAAMTVTAPLNDHVEALELWSSPEQALWTIYPKYPGIYKITINSDSPDCFPVVYGSGGAVVTGGEHASQVFSGFVQNVHDDTPKPYAVYGAVNYPVFFIYELEGHQLPTETLYTTRMTRRTEDGEEEESYTSDVDLRDGCSYNYIGTGFRCIEEDEVITLSISGVDGNNQPFTRQSTTYC